MNTELKIEKTIAPGETVPGVQLCPFGEFKGVLNKADGKKTPIVQHLDQAAFERILNAWNAAGSPELLVDAQRVGALPFNFSTGEAQSPNCRAKCRINCRDGYAHSTLCLYS